MAKRSRLTKSIETKSRKTIVLSFFGIALTLLLIFKFGIPILSDVSFGISRLLGIVSDSVTETKVEKNIVLRKPVLDPQAKTVKSPSIEITGSTTANTNVLLFINGSKDAEEFSDESGNFSFFITLTEGENIIKSKSEVEEKESEFSNTLFITYKNSPPLLEVEKPTDGSTIKESPTEVRGKTETGVRVIVNGFQAITTGDTFSYFLPVREGENELSIVAVDSAGNENEKTLKVNYSP